jgi:hypothetical protein
LRTRRKPIVELQLTRKQAEVNLLSTLALTEAETASKKADAAEISNVELASTRTGSGCGGMRKGPPAHATEHRHDGTDEGRAHHDIQTWI